MMRRKRLERKRNAFGVDEKVCWEEKSEIERKRGVKERSKEKSFIDIEFNQSDLDVSWKVCDGT